MTRKTWKDKLTKAQRKHLTDVKINTKYSLEIQLKFQKEEFAKPITDGIRCYECKKIFDRLGMW